MGGRKSRVRDVDKIEEEEKEEKKPVIKKPEKVSKKKAVIRVANTDLDGDKPVIHAIRGIKGISFTMSKAIVHVAGIDPRKKLSELTEAEIEKLEKIIKEPHNYGIPAFLLNRRKDPETGKDMHLVGTDLEIAQKFDIKREIELKTYRGWRHMLGQPVRGQRTRSHFRRGATVGVVRKAVKLQQQGK